MIETNLVLNFTEKVKSGIFQVSLNCLFPESNGENSDLTPFTSKIILQSRIDERGDLMKMNSEFERKK